MLVDRREPERADPHELRRGVERAQREVGAAGRRPRRRRLGTGVGTDGPVDQPLEPELGDVAAVLRQRLADHGDGIAGPAAGVPEQEAVAELRRPLQHRRRATAEPDRDRRRRSRQDAGPLDVVVLAVERDDRLGPQPPQHLDLLLQAPGASPVRRAERFVLDPVPARPHAQAQPAARQHGHLGRLLGHERRLALRGDEHADDELDRARHGGEVTEQHERLVEGVVLRVRTPQPRLAVGVLGPEHVVVGDELRAAELLHALGEVADRPWVVADVARREDDAELHR